MMQRALLLIAGLLIMLLGVSPSLAAGDTPPLPAAYYGSVTYDDGSPVQAGAVEAVIDGAICGTISIVGGFYGSPNSMEQKLVVQYPEAVPGKMVHFMVNGVEAEQSVEWKSDTISRLDLVVNRAALPKPLVAAKEPAGAGEAKDAAVSATFNMAVKLVDSSGVAIVNAAGTPVTITNIVLSGSTVNIGHADFDYGKTYLVTIPAGSVQSVTYGTYNDSVSWSFSVSTVPAPAISPAGGAYTGSVAVWLDNIAAGLKAYYTLDGSDPTASGILYSGPFTVSTSGTVKAAAFDSGTGLWSGIASAAFTINQAGGGTVKGSVVPQGLAAGNFAGISVILLNGSQQVSSTTTLADGSYRMDNVPEGNNYTVMIKNARYLSGKIAGVAVSAGSTVNLSAVNLLVGDANGDDMIGGLDFSALLSAWNKSERQSGYNPLCDFNGDNSIGGLDFSLLLQNWNKKGASIP